MMQKQNALFLAASALAFVAASPAQAQLDDQRWLPFIGCWQSAESIDGEDADAGLLCVRPAAGGVDLESVVDGEVVSTERVAGDGVARSVVAEGCEGTEAVAFSADGHRAFTTSEFDCSGEPRSGTGVMAVVAPNRWVDVRALEIQGEKVSWVQSYRLAAVERLAEEGITDPRDGLALTTRAARLAAASDIDVDDVREAAERIDSEAVVAWVAAQENELDIDAETLVALADAGVAEEVIDVIVAVSYPERFVVEPEQPVEMAERAEPRGRRPVYGGYRGYLSYDPFYYGYSPYSYRYGYSPFGYGYGYGSRYAPTILRVERRDNGGRMIRGVGYRPGVNAQPSGRTARPRNDDGGSSAGSGAQSSSGSGAAAGSSGSRSGTSTGRTARRRGGGD